MEKKGFQGIALSRLGMGNMRLPANKSGASDASIDWERAHEIIERALAQGINYFDTAYGYNNGESERCVGAALCKHPRESYFLATKYPIWAGQDCEAVFEEQLARLRTDYIDFYLLHCLTDENLERYLTSGCIDYFEEQQRRGRIRYFGFSSHASPETLQKMADCRTWDFAQLQLNYYDWRFSRAKEEYEILSRRGIPVMVMEPVRGGRLASLTPETEAMLRAAHPDWSIASWALRWARKLPDAQVILSGMSDLEQLRDNVATFESDEPLSDSDEALLMEVCEKFRSQVVVPCTGCRYCCDGCPAQIDIPEYLKAYNAGKVEGAWAKANIMAKIESAGKPEDCTACAACVRHCPQGIDVPKIMGALAEER